MRPPAWSDRLYRLLLRVLPSEFRGDFGDEMAQVFRDERADAQGPVARAHLWWRTLRGFGSLAPREHFHIFLRDAGYGIRLMRRNRLATVAAIITVALGVGANTAMFTVIKAVLLDLPFKDPERLVVVLTRTEQHDSAAITPAQFEIWKRTGALEALAGYWGAAPVLTGAGDAQRVRCECVSPNMFEMLGGTPLAGRTFADREDTLGAESVIVLSERFWAERLTRDPNAIGRALMLDTTPATVVGIMPATFTGPRGRNTVDAWLPLADCIRRAQIERRALTFINAYGKLKAGESATVAEARLTAAIEGAHPGASPVRARLIPLTEQLVGDVRELLLALFGASAFVLLIACANVASLLLGQADGRRRELAVRVALGCSRAALVRQLLTEGLVFALSGGAAGLLVAHWTLQVLKPSMPAWIPGLDRIRLDPSVLIGCLALSVGSGFLFGVLPAWFASQIRPGTALKDTGIGRAPGRRRMRALLVVTEVTLSVALLAGAGLLLKTFLHLRPADPGFNPRGKLTLIVNLPRGRYANEQMWRSFLNTLQRRLADLPGIDSVVATSIVPLSGNINQATIGPVDDNRTMRVDAPIVTASYFEIMGMRIVRGRPISTLDDRGATPVAVLNETLARRLWPGSDPVGRSLAVDLFGQKSTKVIVGIVADVRTSGNRLDARSEIYVPFSQNPTAIMDYIVSTSRPAERMAPMLKKEVASIDAALPVGAIEPLADIVSRSVSTWRFATSVLGAFAALALILAAVGLFAVVGCWVTERTPEIGVRLALGAGRGRVSRMLVGRAGMLTACGLVVGLALAALTTRYLKEWLVDTTPLDRSALGGAMLLMATVALTASYVAARRAARIDPIAALRAE